MTKKKHKQRKSLGNPLIAAAASQHAPLLIKESSSLINKVLNVVLIAGGATVLFFLGRKFILDARRAKIIRELGDSPEGQQAVAINEAMGYFGTDEELIYRTAEQITDWKAVQDAYKKLYNIDIIKDLQSARGLDAQEMEKFLEIIKRKAKARDFETKAQQNKPTGTQDVAKEKPGATAKDLKNAAVTTLVATNLRTSAKLVKPTIPKTFIGSNIIKTAPANMIIGQLTGEEALDAENDVIFLQISGYMRDKSNNKKIIRRNFWVAKSQVNVLPSGSTIFQNQYKGKPEKLLVLDYLPSLGTPAGFNVYKIYITTDRAKILTPKMKDYKEVEKNTVIGVPLNEVIITTDGTRFVKFVSPRCSVLFIDKSKVRTV